VDERVGQDLQGDVAIQLRIARPIDLAHAASPEGRQDLVRTQAGTGTESQVGRV
jgi:hypothetical protein